MPKIQSFEETLIHKTSPIIQQHEEVMRPFIKIMSEPIDILHCDSVKTISAFKSLSGRWSYVKARPSIPSASRQYSVRPGPITLSGTTLYLFKDTEQIDSKETDEDGVAVFDFQSKQPSFGNYTVTMLPELAPISNPLQDDFQLAVWLVTCKIQNLTDRWWRFAGRSFSGELPRYFWRKPLYTIGLGAPSGIQRFVDFVPVFGDQTMTLEYGISAMCNTPDPYPTKYECIAARKKTWWKFTVEGFNGKSTKSVDGELNIDRHLRVTFTHDNMTAEVVKPDGAET